MNGRVLRLAARDMATLDRGRIALLRMQHGADAAGALVEDAAFRLAEGLGQVEARAAEGDLAALTRHAEGIGAIAARLGLTSLAPVARDLAAAAAGGDATAARAVAARLLRIGEDSLCAIAREIG
jgi:hypothetical protein